MTSRNATVCESVMRLMLWEAEQWVQPFYEEQVTGMEGYDALGPQTSVALQQSFVPLRPAVLLLLLHLLLPLLLLLQGIMLLSCCVLQCCATRSRQL